MEDRSNVNNLPLVSILIPTYNREKYIERCITSAIQQDYPNLEIIVSDNASTDRTSEIINKFIADKRFKYIRNTNNIGLFDNWYKLLYELANGEFGIILPDDDYLVDKSHITKAINLVKKFNVNYVFTDSIWVDEIQNTIIDKNYDIPQILTPDWAVKHIGKRVKPSNIFFLPGLPSLFSINVGKELKVLQPGCSGFDGEMGTRFMFSGNTAYLKGAQRAATTHADSAGNTDSILNVLDGLDVYLRTFEFGKKNKLALKDLKKYRDRMVIIHIRNLLLPVWKKHKTFNILSMICLYSQIIRQVKKKFNFILSMKALFSFEIFAKIIALQFPILTRKIRSFNLVKSKCQ
jgi:glycosyltransferase involved in cell wall biosynthesis